MRTLLVPAICCALVACSLFDRSAHVESSVFLLPNGRSTTSLRTDGELAVDLCGLGPGGVTFDARSRDGSVLSHGVLTTNSHARCVASDGELTLTFVADAAGGEVRLHIRTDHGVAMTTTPQ